MLYLISTPIGNLKDITLRALEILNSVEIVLVESYQDSIKLLHHYQIKPADIIVYNDSNRRRTTNNLLSLLQEKDAAYITSAGTPGISDPAADLVKQCHEHGIQVVPIPGPSALSTAMAMSGCYGDFLFVGFFPRKQGPIKKIINEAKANNHNLVFFESTHRLSKTFELLNQNLPDAEVFLGKEMTKKFEQYLYGRPADILVKLQKEKNFTKGEFVIIIKAND